MKFLSSEPASAMSARPARVEHACIRDDGTGVYFRPVSSALVDLEDLIHNK
jgi:hypothetical protein